jgi:Carboxypeptidase regulatory-like domain
VIRHPIALPALLLTASTFAQPPTGGIHGTVVDAVTRQPVKRATVQPLGLNRNAPPAITAADGTFTLNNVTLGHIRITASGPGYPTPGAATVDVNAGEVTLGVTIELIPGAAVSGHIVDEDGEPMRGCQAAAHPASRPSEDRATGSTSNSGEYRLEELPAGPYLISVNCQAVPFTPRPLSSGPDPPPTSAYPRHYFSGALDAKSAVAVTLSPGAEYSGVDFQMRPTSVFQVRGTFSVAGSGTKGIEAPVNLLLISPESQIGPTDLNPGRGTFVFDRVFPGSYDLLAFTFAPEARVGGFMHVEVKNRPVETALELTHGFDVNGNVTLDTTGNTISLAQLRINLYPSPAGFGELGDSVKPDGTFTIKNVLPGKWRLRVQGPRNVFVRSAAFGDADVSTNVFPVNGAGSLRIVLSDKTGIITGTAEPGTMVVLGGEGGQPIRGVQADAGGHFRMDAIVPGTYVVGPGDPGGGLMRLLRDAGRTIVVHEGETVTVEVNQP